MWTAVNTTEWHTTKVGCAAALSLLNGTLAFNFTRVSGTHTLSSITSQNVCVSVCFISFQKQEVRQRTSLWDRDRGLQGWKIRQGGAHYISQTIYILTPYYVNVEWPLRVIPLKTCRVEREHQRAAADERCDMAGTKRQKSRDRWVCRKMCVHRWLQKEERQGSRRNLSKPLVILGKLFISCSFSAGCAPSEHRGVLCLSKAYCCCNHTSNQTAVILCHSPTILQRLSAAGWEDIGWDCLKLNRFYLFPERRRAFLISF